MRTAAVLPVKRFEQAKKRLGEALDPPGRQALAQAMLGDVLEALASTPELDAVILVSGEPLALEAAATLGMDIVPDPDDAGQSAAVALGVRRAMELGCDRALLVPGDCPALDPSEVSALLVAETGRSGSVIVADRHGTGTNALLLSPPDAFAAAFGPGSRDRHESLARAAGARLEARRLPSLELDVDTGDDLAALRAALDRRPDLARRTRALLESAAPRAA